MKKKQYGKRNRFPHLFRSGGTRISYLQLFAKFRSLVVLESKVCIIVLDTMKGNHEITFQNLRWMRNGTYHMKETWPLSTELVSEAASEWVPGSLRASYRATLAVAYQHGTPNTPTQQAACTRIVPACASSVFLLYVYR